MREQRDILDVALLVAGALERCGVAYFLGGSLASSFQGEPRATNDIDLVVALAPSAVGSFITALGPEFDVDGEALERAARERGTWNIIHLPTITKVDLFVLREGAFDQSEFGRRERVAVRDGRALFVKRAEDTVLRKLLGFRAGGGVSDRQWRDLVEVLRHSRALLDPAYLDAWAAQLDLGALLERARQEAGVAR